MTYFEEDKQTEPDEAESAEEETQTTEQTEATTEEESSKSEAKSEESESAKSDVSQVSLEEILERDDVQRTLQSISDRAAARTEKRLEQRQKQEADTTRSRVDAEERKKLIDEEDYETLGKKEAERTKWTEEFMEHAAQFGTAFTTKMREKYSPSLGEETVEQIIDQVEKDQGSIVDLTTSLAEESQKRAVATATDDIKKTIREEMKSDIEALRAEAGLQKRSDASDKGDTSSAEVSSTQSESASTEEMTYEKASTLYGEGEMSYEEFKPFEEEHDRGRQR